jgi:hypothetical protein
MSSEKEIDRWDDSRRPEWFKRIPIEEYEKLAGIGYTPKQIAMYYDVKFSEFMFYYSLIGSPLKYHYDRGQLMQQAKEGISMADAASTGENVTQAQRFDRFRKGLDVKNAVNKIFFDELDI